ncbi:MAG: hypothetical protein WBE27_02885, partial [Microgenomates group bacterium]
RLSHFYRRKTGKRAGESYEKCKQCMKLRGRRYYHENKKRQLPLALARTRKARKQKSEFIREIKNKACIDCGLKYPHYVMDFDHRNDDDKIINVAHAVTRNWSLTRIKEEIEKCDVVCANCHRIRTFKDKLR